LKMDEQDNGQTQANDFPRQSKDSMRGDFVRASRTMLSCATPPHREERRCDAYVE